MTLYPLPEDPRQAAHVFCDILFDRYCVVVRLMQAN